jgi:peptide/nickel transport system permease protein
MGLKSYIAKRVMVAIMILWVVATLNFIIFVVSPGDPVRYLLNPGMKQEQKELIYYYYGLREGWGVRYVKYLANMFSYGIVPPYFGYSFETRTTVASEMSWRLGITLFLLGAPMIGRIILGIPIGMFAASKRGTKTDVAIMGSALFTWGVPIFFIELLAILLFSWLLMFHGIYVFPLAGLTSVPAPTGLALYANMAWHLTLPMLCLVLAGLGSWALYTRNLLIDALTQDYVVTARAKGVSERAILFKHAFKSILPPIATMITLAVPGVVTGAIITETVFGIEGIGKWYIHALGTSVADYPVVQAVLFIFATLVIICNLIADLLYGVLDPRIRVGTRR